MEGINREYATRVHNYIAAMTYYEGMLDGGEISAEDYNKIEIKILTKYQLPEESIFRMKKETSEYDKTAETITLDNDCENDL